MPSSDSSSMSFSIMSTSYPVLSAMTSMTTFTAAPVSEWEAVFDSTLVKAEDEDDAAESLFVSWPWFLLFTDFNSCSNNSVCLDISVFISFTFALVLFSSCFKSLISSLYCFLNSSISLSNWLSVKLISDDDCPVLLIVYPSLSIRSRFWRVFFDTYVVAFNRRVAFDLTLLWKGFSTCQGSNCSKLIPHTAIWSAA